MKRTRLLVLIAASLALTSGGPSASARPTTGDIHRIDFRNFTYTDTGCAGEGKPLTVKNGSYERDVDDDKVYFEVRDVVYGDLTGDGDDEAVVTTLCNTGGTGQFTDGIVYTMRGGKPVALGTLGVGDRADGGLYRVAVRVGMLVQERFGHGAGGGACCPEYVEAIPMRWNGKQFVAAGKPTRRIYQDYLSDDGPAPRAVRFLRGTSAATLVGLTNDHESYSLGARAGQTLALRLDTRDSTAEAVITAKDGQRLGSATGAATLSIKLPATGDYVITLRSSKATDDADAYYALDLSIL